MALYTMVMEEITPAAFFTSVLLILMVVLYRTFVAMNNSSNTNAQPIHQGEVTTEHQFSGSPSQLSLLGSSERTTSSTAFQGASSSFSSSSIRTSTYDVFLSFRGPDTRGGFISHLHKALLQNGIKNTFIDDEELKSSEEISLALLKAIEESKISIVTLSENYASSKWCLDELLKILETKDQKVIPVFYKVNSADVRYQKNKFQEALDKHRERLRDDIKVQRWKVALTEVTNKKGFDLKNYKSEAELIDMIIQDVLRIVNPKYLEIAKHPIGIDSHVQQINSLLSIEMNDICMVGILGAGGIGKTTIAKAIYNLIHHQFEGSCFLENVGKTSFVKLQKTLLSKVLGHTMKIGGVYEGITMIKNRLCSKRVLFILDGVDKSDQLENLAGNVDWFGVGSRIIITTRDKKVLTNHKVVDDLIYKVKVLDRDEASKLFCWHAFQRDKPTDGFLEVTKDAIDYAGGLPLALEVLGLHLYGVDIQLWKEALVKYKRIPNQDIQKILEISFEGLESTEKDIFLDIACFFNGKRVDEVIKIFNSYNVSTNHDIEVLEQKSLITSKTYKLAMHDLLQDMGREVVRKQSKEPNKRSRLWFYDDVCEVLEKDKGTDQIQGLSIDVPEGHKMCLSLEVFKNMQSLRLLMVKGDVRFPQGPVFLPNELRLLKWPNCPLESFSFNFRGQKLVVLKMPRSHLKELKGIQNFQQLKIMDFMECKFLKTTSDVSSIPNLEDLNLNDCRNLVEIHHSVGCHDKLVQLSVGGCYNLSSFPRSIRMRSLEDLNVEGCSSLSNFPEIECEMKSLTSIEFGGTGIKELPPSIRHFTGLLSLSLNNCINLTNLPSSIYELQHLMSLVLDHCSKFAKFPKKIGDSRQSMPPLTNFSVSNDDCSSKVFPALRALHLRECVLLESADFLRIFNCYSTLETLDLSGSGIVTVPACIKRFVALEKFEVDDCKQLREIQAFPPTSYGPVDARGCMSLELYNKCWLLELLITGPVGVEASSSINCTTPVRGPYENEPISYPDKELLEKREFSILISGNKIPDWFSYRKEVSNSNSCEIEIDVPADLDGEISRIVFSAVIEAEDYEFSSIIIWIYVISCGVEIYRGHFQKKEKEKEIYRGREKFLIGHWDCVWLRLCVLKPCKLKELNGHLRVKFDYKIDPTKTWHKNLKAMKSCGVHLVRRCEEKTMDSIDGIQVTKRPCDDDDDDDKFESNCYPRQQKRHSSTLGIRISDTEAEAE